jgi:PhnB protein
MQIQTYLNFDGRCEEALEFYRKALGAQVQMMMRFKDAPDPAACPPGSNVGDKVMHAAFTVGDTLLMASDGYAKGKPAFQGISLTYNAADEADAEKRFAALGDGGQVQVPLSETFFAKSFGMLADRFGVSWMVMAGPKNP